LRCWGITTSEEIAPSDCKGTSPYGRGVDESINMAVTVARIVLNCGKLSLATSGKRRPSAPTSFNSLAAATNSALVMVPKRRGNPGLCELQRADCASLLDQAAILWVVSQKNVLKLQVPSSA